MVVYNSEAVAENSLPVVNTQNVFLSGNTASVSGQVFNNQDLLPLGGSVVYKKGTGLPVKGIDREVEFDEFYYFTRLYDGKENASFRAEIPGLDPNTNYTFRPVGTNAEAFNYGGATTITTPPGSGSSRISYTDLVGEVTIDGSTYEIGNNKTAVTATPDNNFVYFSGFNSFNSDNPNLDLVIYAFRVVADSLEFIDGYYGNELIGEDLRFIFDLEISPDGRHLYASMREKNSVLVFTIENDGQLTLVERLTDGGTDNAGNTVSLFRPRDLTFTSNGEFGYVVTDRDASFDKSELIVFNRDPDSGQLTFVEVINMVDDEGEFLEWGQFVMVTPDNRHLYVGTGAVEQPPISLSHYEINSTTGQLTRLNTTRDRNVANAKLLSDATGNYLYGFGNSSRSLYSYARNAETGELTQIQEIKGSDNINPFDLGVIIDIALGRDGQFYASSGNDGIGVYEIDPLTNELVFYEQLEPFVPEGETINPLDGFTKYLAIGNNNATLAATSSDALAIFNLTEREIITPTAPAILINSPATEISSRSAEVGAEVTDIDRSKLTEQGFYVSSTPGASASDRVITVPIDALNGAFSARIDALNANTTYYVKAFATNPVGTSVSEEITFNTVSRELNFRLVGSIPEPSTDPQRGSLLRKVATDGNRAIASYGNNKVFVFENVSPDSWDEATSVTTNGDIRALDIDGDRMVVTTSESFEGVDGAIYYFQFNDLQLEWISRISLRLLTQVVKI